MWHFASWSFLETPAIGTIFVTTWTSSLETMTLMCDFLSVLVVNMNTDSKYKQSVVER